MWHSHPYPGMFALLMSDKQEEREHVLLRVEEDFTSWQAADSKADEQKCWKQVTQASHFRTTLAAKEYAGKLLDTRKPKDERLGEVTKALGLLFSGFGQTKVVEGLFHDLRAGEQTYTGSKSLNLKMQLSVAQTETTLQSHGRPQVGTPGPQPAEKLTSSCPTPSSTKLCLWTLRHCA